MYYHHHHPNTNDHQHRRRQSNQFKMDQLFCSSLKNQKTNNSIIIKYLSILLLMFSLFSTKNLFVQSFRPYNYYAPHQYPETGPLSYK